jgi:hypothetical protein
MKRTKGHPVPPAYTDTGSLHVDCTNCGAEPGQWCARDDGRIRRMPCIARIASSGAVTTTAVTAVVVPIDFNQPRHTKEDQ